MCRLAVITRKHFHSKKSMKVILLVFTVLLAYPLSAQDTINRTDAKGNKQGCWRKKDADGALIYTGRFVNNIPQGEFRHFYPDNKLRMVMQYSPDGKQAQAVSYHPNGIKMAEGLYTDTKKEGPWKYYNDKGNLVSEENYAKGIPSGEWITWFESGSVLERTTYVNGTREGECLTLFQDGTVEKRVIYVKGKLNGPAGFFYPDGRVMVKGAYKNDQKEGKWEGFLPDSRPEYLMVYRDGVLVEEKWFDRTRIDEITNPEKEIKLE